METYAPPPVYINISVNDKADDMVSDATSPTLTQMETPTPPLNSRGIKREADICVKTNSSQYDKLLDLEQKEIKLLAERSQSQEDNDNDLLLFKSLIPYIKNIAVERRVAFEAEFNC